MVHGRGSQEREVGHLDLLNTKTFLARIPLMWPFNNTTLYFCHGVPKVVKSSFVYWIETSLPFLMFYSSYFFCLFNLELSCLISYFHSSYTHSRIRIDTNYCCWNSRLVMNNNQLVDRPHIMYMCQKQFQNKWCCQLIQIFFQRYKASILLLDYLKHTVVIYLKIRKMKPELF
jgi:hypothetical protein